MKAIIITLYLLISLPDLFSATININTVNGNYSFELVEVSNITFSGTIVGNDFNNIAEISHIFNVMNFPNPFAVSNNKRQIATSICFSLKNSGKTKLEIFNLKGQLVRTLVDDFLKEGDYNISWDGKNTSAKLVSSGVYFYRISQNNQFIVKKMLLSK